MYIYIYIKLAIYVASQTKISRMSQHA